MGCFGPRKKGSNELDSPKSGSSPQLSSSGRSKSASSLNSKRSGKSSGSVSGASSPEVPRRSPGTTSPPSSFNSNSRLLQPTATSRARSADQSALPRTPSSTSLRSASSPDRSRLSPNMAHPQRPQQEGTQSLSGTRTSSTHTPPPNPRTASSISGSTANAHRSPVSQMRHEFDELKSKHEQSQNIVAAQSAEIESLKAQLAQASATLPSLPPTPSSVPTEQDHRATLEDLAHKDEVLMEKENELQMLRDALEKEKQEREKERKQNEGMRPSSEVKELQEKNESTLALLEEKERQLRERQEDLDRLRDRWEQDMSNALRPALQDVEDQLAQLRLENEATVSRLQEKERDLQKLRDELQEQQHLGQTLQSQIESEEARQREYKRLTVDLEKEKENLRKLDELSRQLEAQKEEHEAMLESRDQILAEKDRLLSEHQANLEKLHLSHQTALQELQRQQSAHFANLRQQHAKELEGLRAQLQEAERIAQSASAPAQAQAQLDAEIEKLLREVEAAEHSHIVELDSLEKRHSAQLEHLANNHTTQLRQLRSVQQQEAKDKRMSWKQQFAPTDAVSWPAPSVALQTVKLRKTGGPRRQGGLAGGSSQTEDSAPSFVSDDPSKIQLYMSSVSGNMKIKSAQEQLKNLLDSRDLIYEIIDVASTAGALAYIRERNGGERDLPQVFVGGVYKGLLHDVMEADEAGNLDTFLHSSQTARKAPTVTDTPNRMVPKAQPQVSRVPLSGDDAELLRELEQEISAGLVSKDEWLAL